MIYSDMVGLQEIVQFMAIANETERELFKEEVRNGEAENALRRVSRVLKITVTLDMIQKKSPL